MKPLGWVRFHGHAWLTEGPMKIVMIDMMIFMSSYHWFLIIYIYKNRFPSFSNDNSEHPMADSTGRICCLCNKTTMKVCNIYTYHHQFTCIVVFFPRSNMVLSLCEAHLKPGFLEYGFLLNPRVAFEQIAGGHLVWNWLYSLLQWFSMHLISSRWVHNLPCTFCI